MSQKDYNEMMEFINSKIGVFPETWGALRIELTNIIEESWHRGYQQGLMEGQIDR